MTEAVILMLIAFGGMTLFFGMAIILVNVISTTKPTHIHFKTAFGQFKLDYDTKVDE